MHPNDLLERRCLSDCDQIRFQGFVCSKANVVFFCHVIFFGPRAVALGIDLVRMLIRLKISILTPESVEKYKREMVDNFFTSMPLISMREVYELYGAPNVKETISCVNEAVCNYFPEPLKTIRESLPHAGFLVETVEVYGTEVTSFLVIRQGNRQFYLHVFEYDPMLKRAVERSIGNIALSF